MSILDMKGKKVSAGPLNLYHLSDGAMFYSEEVKDDGDSFYFQGDKTVLLKIVKQSGNQASLQAQKLSESSFNPQGLRLLKTSVQMVTDLNDAKVTEVVMQAMTGLILPNGGN